MATKQAQQLSKQGEQMIVALHSMAHEVSNAFLREESARERRKVDAAAFVTSKRTSVLKVMDDTAIAREDGATFKALSPHQEVFHAEFIKSSWKGKGFKGEIAITPGKKNKLDEKWISLGTYASQIKSILLAGNIAKANRLTTAHFNRTGLNGAELWDAWKWLHDAGSWSDLVQRASTMRSIAAYAGLIGKDDAPKRRGARGAANGDGIKVTDKSKAEYFAKLPSFVQNAGDGRVLVSEAMRVFLGQTMRQDARAMIQQATDEYLSIVNRALEPATVAQTPNSTATVPVANAPGYGAHAVQPVNPDPLSALSAEQRAAIVAHLLGQPSPMNDATMVPGTLPNVHPDSAARVAERDEIAAKRIRTAKVTAHLPNGETVVSETPMDVQVPAKRTRRSKAA